ncbi:MAG: hypothetical protein JXR25_15180 [Pontiellaceae bacterium]|nr:hypothetical protein [Pontiellaceae bacterium]MBN2786163.1 hypothetical protein [Pontiellaceae bacterium]
MRIEKKIIRMVLMALMVAATAELQAQTVNTWRGDAVESDWNENFKWKLNHPPATGEAAHFRGENSIISINSTVELNNGMHLYGQALLLKGNGNINLRSLVEHERTVNIPASADGYATLTLCDNLSLNGRIALSAKGFGTSACKGTLTLKNRTTVTGGLEIGEAGVGTGQVFVQDNAIYRITNLNLNTLAEKGGMAEIHILGGTVRIDVDGDPFAAFMEDSSRKIIIGDTGTLRIESDLPIEEKKQMIKDMISSNRLIPASGCQLTTPILQDEMMIARAESSSVNSTLQDRDALLASIDTISNSLPQMVSAPSDLGDLVKALHSQVSGESGKQAEVKDQQDSESSSLHLAGYIVFFGSILLTLRRSATEE